MNSPFIGRKPELDALRQAMSGVEGAGRFVSVAGEAGMGKTRLVSEIADIARAEGKRVLWSQMLEDSGAPPYFSWMLALRACVQQCGEQALREDLGSGASDVADILPELRERLGIDKRVSGPGDGMTRYRLFDSVTRFLLAVSRRQPLILLFDNLHSADRSSLAMLEYFCQQITDNPILVVVAYRDSELDRRHPLRPAMSRLMRSVGHLHLVLTGLSRTEVAELLHARLGFVSAGSMVDAVCRQSDGNPLFVSEVASILGREQPRALPSGAGHHFEVPASLRDVIATRLETIPRDIRSLLGVASVLGREFSVVILARLAMARPERVANHLRQAEAAGVVTTIRRGRYRFHHVLFREVLYAEHSAVSRVMLHRRAGEQLEAGLVDDDSARLSELAHHFFESARAGEEEKAIRYCRRAAESAISQRAYGEAVTNFDCALQLCELEDVRDDGRRVRLMTSMGQAQYQSGELAAATQTLLKAAVLAYRRRWWKLLADALFQFQLICQQSGYRHVVSVPLHNAVLENTPQDNRELRARVLASLAKAYRTDAQPALAATTFRDAVALARQLDDPAVLLDCLRKGNWSVGRTPSTMREGLDFAREALALARAQDNVEAVLDSVVDLIFQLCDLGEIDEILQQIEALRQSPEEERLPHIRNVLTGFSTAIAILRGDWNDALRGAMDGVRQLPLQGVRGLRGRFSFQVFSIRKAQGRLDEIQDAAERVIAQSGDSQLWLPGQALLHVELGQKDAAREVLKKLGDLHSLPDDDLREVALIYLAEVCIRLSDTDRCAVLYEALLPYRGLNVTLPGTFMLGAVSGYLAILAVAMNRCTDAKPMFEEALIMNTRMGALPALARTQVDFARLLLRSDTARERTRARRMIAEARRVAHDLELQPVIREIDELDERAGAESLTGREIDVLKTIVKGLSNRAIADVLNISHSTVATHIRNIFRKISVANRTEAADFARRTGMLDRD